MSPAPELNTGNIALAHHFGSLLLLSRWHLLINDFHWNQDISNIEDGIRAVGTRFNIKTVFPNIWISIIFAADEHNASTMPRMFQWCVDTGPLFTKQYDALQPNLVKSRNRDIGCDTDCIALKFDRHHGNDAAEVPVNFKAIGKV